MEEKHPAVRRAVKTRAALNCARREETGGGEHGEPFAVLRGGESGGRFDDRSAIGPDKLGPDAMPGLLAKRPATQLAAAGLFKLASTSGVHVTEAGEALVEVLLVDAVSSCEAAPVLGSDLLHPHHLSDSLANVQANRYAGIHRGTVSYALEPRSVETNSERRRRKLQVLVSAHGIGQVAEKAGRSPEYLAQILARTLLPTKVDGSRSERSLGDDAARAIEEAYGLGRGWFDNDDEESTMTPDESETQAVAIENLRVTLEEAARIRDRLRLPAGLQSAPPQTVEADAKPARRKRGR